MMRSLLLIFFFSLTLAIHAFAADPVFTNLASLTDADRFSKQLVAEDEANPDRKEKRSFVIAHLGEVLPEELKWVALNLKKEGHDVSIKLIKEEDVFQDLENEANEAEKSLYRLSYADDALKAQNKKELAGIFSRSKLYVKRLFGLPQGMTFWFKIKKTKEQVRANIAFATLQGLLAGASTFGTFYLKEQSGAELNIYAPAIAILVWHGLNMFYHQNITALLSQGLSVKKISENEVAIKKGVILSRVLSFIRSLISNAIVLTAAFGPEAAFSPPSLLISLTNSFMGLFSRFWFDEWLASKQATLKKDGTIVVEHGQFSVQQQTKLRNIFEFTNGLAKSMNLVKLPYVSLLFPASGIFGLIRTAYHDRYQYLESVKSIFKKVNKSVCQSLLIEEPATE